MNDKIKKIVALLVSMEVETKPSVSDIKAAGMKVSSAERDEAWELVKDENSKPHVDEKTTETLYVRTKEGIPSRYRAGCSFGRQWQAVDCSQLSAKQEVYITNDKKLEVTASMPATMKEVESEA